MHCKRASIKYIGGVEQIALNMSCDAKAVCGCLQIYENKLETHAFMRKVSNYAHENYMVLQQRIDRGKSVQFAFTIFAASYNVMLDNHYKFMKVSFPLFERHKVMVPKKLFDYYVPLGEVHTSSV